MVLTWSKKSRLLKWVKYITFSTSLMLVLLSLLLLLIFLIFPLLDFGIRLPPSFSVEDDVAFGVHRVWYFGKTIVSTTGTKFDFALGDVDLFETEVTFPDESSDGGNQSTIQCNQLNAHVSGYILDRIIRAN